MADRAAGLLREFRVTRVIFGAAAPLGLLAPSLRRAGARQIVGFTHGHETWWSQVAVARRLLRRIGDSCDHLTTISGYTERRIASALSPNARRRLLGTGAAARKLGRELRETARDRPWRAATLYRVGADAAFAAGYTREAASCLLAGRRGQQGGCLQ